MATCLLSADLYRMDGTPYDGARVQVTNLFDPEAGLAYMESTTTYTADDDGYVSFAVVRGLRIRVNLVGTPFTRDLTVPDSPTADLLTLMGSTPDPFQPVEP